MITKKDCLVCPEAERLLEKQIESGKIKVLSADTPEGKALADKYNIRATPTMIYFKDSKGQPCLLSKDGKKIYCDDGTEKVI